MDTLADFTAFAYLHQGKERIVYRRGTGPAVIVMHEIPGITPQVARFSRYVADAGMTVFMPSLFGIPGKPATALYAARQLAGACISREFRVLAANRSSPIVDWLRALARRAFAELGGRGVGAVGMCLTGNFALTMLLERCVVAPVLSQPSLPLPLTRGKAAAVHATSEAMANVRTRCVEDGLKVIGLRFAGDPICPPARFKTLQRQLGEGFEAIELADATANGRASKPAHCVLTLHLIDADGEPTKAALEKVLRFLRERLL
jgi:dienelactone hydrolase